MQYACSIANATDVHGRFDNLLLDLRRLTGIGILQQEGATHTALLAAAVALLALLGLSMADNISTLTLGQCRTWMIIAPRHHAGVLVPLISNRASRDTVCLFAYRS
jgi:hypothetical protein